MVVSGHPAAMNFDTEPATGAVRPPEIASGPENKKPAKQPHALKGKCEIGGNKGPIVAIRSIIRSVDGRDHNGVTRVPRG